jgi:hypothetical protein
VLLNICSSPLTSLLDKFSNHNKITIIIINYYSYTCTYPEGKMHNQTDHVLVDRRQLSNLLDIRSSKGDVCDTDHYLVVAEVKERLAVGK